MLGASLDSAFWSSLSSMSSGGISSWVLGSCRSGLDSRASISANLSSSRSSRAYKRKISFMKLRVSWSFASPSTHLILHSLMILNPPLGSLSGWIPDLLVVLELGSKSTNSTLILSIGRSSEKLLEAVFHSSVSYWQG